MWTNHHWMSRLAIGILAAGLGAPELLADEAAGTAEQISGSEARFASRNPRYRLQLSDELEISFRFTPEFDQAKITVQPDGFISLPDVGDLKVGGLTVDEVRKAIVERYSGILNDPVVTVKLLNFSKPAFVVGGEVVNPGRFDYHDDITMTDAIAMAGGFTVGARTTEVMLFRRISPDTVEAKKVNVKIAQNGRIEEDVQLRTGDSIFVPRSKVGKIERFMSVTRFGLYFPLPF